jgi:uncharacterized protein (TIGR03546 family)
MLRKLLKPVQMLIDAFLETDTPGQLAAGLVLGMFLGLIPKGNLLAVAFSVVLLGTQANLVTGAIGTALFASLNVWTDRFTSQWGYWLLEHPTLKPHWARLYNVPLAAWTHFNNTVVLGSLVLGLALAVPVFLVTRWAVARWRAPLAEWVEKYKLGRLLTGTRKATQLMAS